MDGSFFSTPTLASPLSDYNIFAPGSQSSNDAAYFSGGSFSGHHSLRNNMDGLGQYSRSQYSHGNITSSGQYCSGGLPYGGMRAVSIYSDSHLSRGGMSGGEMAGFGQTGRQDVRDSSR